MHGYSTMQPHCIRTSWRYCERRVILRYAGKKAHANMRYECCLNCIFCFWIRTIELSGAETKRRSRKGVDLAFIRRIRLLVSYFSPSWLESLWLRHYLSVGVFGTSTTSIVRRRQRWSTMLQSTSHTVSRSATLSSTPASL